jgi:hypothetical protein
VRTRRAGRVGKREEGRGAGGARLGTAPAPAAAFERATQGAGGDSKANGRRRLPARVAGVRAAGCPAFQGRGRCPPGVTGRPQTWAQPAAGGGPWTRLDTYSRGGGIPGLPGGSDL